MRGRGVVAVAVSVVALGGGVAFASGAGTTTARTIADRDGDNRLEPAPGEDYVVRPDLGTPSPDRDRTRVPLLTFAQLTDFQLVDEESPARVEFLDQVGGPFTAAYRPEEGMTPQLVDSMVEEVRNAVSPATHRQVDLAVDSGDSTDNTQCNEARWYIDVLDGAANGAAAADVPGYGHVASCVPEDLRPSTSEIDPDSGVSGSCGTPPGRRYDGVRGSDQYYEPDSSAVPGADEEDGPGYSPDVAENEREAQRSNSVRDWPGLFTAMEQPFRATGLGDIPWYAVFGNHDGLVQGNAPRNPAFDAVAQGCVKVTGLPPAALNQVRDRVQAGDAAGAAALADQYVEEIAAHPDQYDPGLTTIVPSDPRRHLLFKREFMAQHFLTSGTPAGHGFTAQDLATGQGYYAFTPRPGLRFVVLDSIAEGGGDGGNIDETQFRWLDGQLTAADAARELTVVFAHHTLETMHQPPVSEFPPGDQDGDHDPVVHFGEVSPQTQCPEPGLETLKCLFLRHPTVVAFVTGHEHDNRIRPVPRTAPATGGFWEIVTASEVDWPQQSRLIDLVDNRDGTLSIFGTILDHAGPPQPGAGEPGPSTTRLASIARELAFNDPDADNGEDGHPDARGTRADRNVELVVDDPR